MRRVFAVLTILVVASGLAAGNPMFGIHTLPEWEDALNGGQIEPVPAADFQAMIDQAEWPLAYEQDAYFATPELYVMEHTDSLGDTSPGLVMYWGVGDVVGPGGVQVPEPPPDAFVGAAWDYVYDEDPDLTGARLEFSIHVPGPGMFFSLNLIDEDGDFMEWVWQADPDPAVPGFPWCQWTTVIVDPNTGWTNWGSSLVSVDPTGLPGPFMGGPPGGDGLLDLTRVTRIRFDEMGRWMDPALMTDFQGRPWMWNAWDHVEVHPEPGTMLLLGGGLLALLRKRRGRH